MDRGLSQPELAKLLGSSVETITNWELNHSFPKINYWPAIIAFLGYDPLDDGDMSLGSVLLRYRRQKGIRRNELARRIGVDESTIYGWTKGVPVKYKRTKRQLKHFFEKEGIQVICPKP